MGINVMIQGFIEHQLKVSFGCVAIVVQVVPLRIYRQYVVGVDLLFLFLKDPL